MMTIKDTIKYYRDVRREDHRMSLLESGAVSYRNWWYVDNPAEIWFTRFITHYFPDHKKKIRFYGVMGNKKNLRETFPGVKVFFTGENVSPIVSHPGLSLDPERKKLLDRRIRLYGDYGEGIVDYSMGFVHRKANWYTRFPLWILYLFEPEDDYYTICTKMKTINDMLCSMGRRGAAVIASHDDFGSRGRICDDVSDVLSVSYAGKWRNNSDELWKKYGNDKIRFLSSFRFNICPENMDAEGYTTENIFDAFRSGTIPLYEGALGQPEPEVIEPESYIHWNFEGSNTDALEEIKRLSEDDHYYALFMKKPRFKPEASDYIWECIEQFRGKMEELIYC